MSPSNAYLIFAAFVASLPVAVQSQLNMFLRNPVVLHGDNSYAHSQFAVQNLEKRLRTLERLVENGGLWGCEHGEVGPLNFIRSRATVKFRRRYNTPPAMIVALSGFAGSLTSTAVRATSVSTTSAIIILLDRNSVNLNQVRATWMACPHF